MNDNKPAFPGTYTANVSATVPIGYVVKTVKATDADTVSITVKGFRRE